MCWRTHPRRRRSTGRAFRSCRDRVDRDEGETVIAVRVETDEGDGARAERHILFLPKVKRYGTDKIPHAWQAQLREPHCDLRA
jgi:hypothetical protein